MFMWFWTIFWLGAPEKWQTYREFSHSKTDKWSLSHTFKKTLHPFLFKRKKNIFCRFFHLIWQFMARFGCFVPKSGFSQKDWHLLWRLAWINHLNGKFSWQLPHRSKDAYVCYSLTKSLYLSYTYNSTREILILSIADAGKRYPFRAEPLPIGN